MRTITLEEHYATAAFLDGPGRQLRARGTKIVEQLCDLGERRIADMDAAQIDVQVLSLTSPGTEQLAASEAIALSREVNDTLAKAIQLYPARLAGFAALPTADPDAAAAELEHTVRNYGFKGVMINGHIRCRYLEDQFFWPILERAEALGVPVYIHPTLPPKPVIDASYGGFSPAVTEIFAGAGWGWHIETAVHVLRLILGGVFDRFPKLQVVIGHMGEALPFMLPRFQNLTMEITKLRRPIAAYLRENVHYTFSGFNFTPTFLDLLLEVGVDRIMFSADYPYASMERARSFLEQLPVSEADRERIAHGNAGKLFQL
jgi:predicted TIM-barrel fold metal-dependent hydrolase